MGEDFPSGSLCFKIKNQNYELRNNKIRIYRKGKEIMA